MYNSETEKKIKNIPVIGEIDNERLPQELTKIFAQIVSLRKRLVDGDVEFSEDFIESIEVLRSLTNNLETLILTNPNHPDKESIAFVSATSHHLLLQIRDLSILNISGNEMFSIDTISPSVSAILLFLIANSQADAAEIAANFQYNSSSIIQNTLLKYVSALARGNLLVFRNRPDLTIDKLDIVSQALDVLWRYIILGIRNIGLKLLGEEISKDINYFDKVIELAVFNNDATKSKNIYSGPYHLAKLLKALESDLLKRGVVNVNAPLNVENEKWLSFLQNLAINRPYLWENHYQVVETGFLNNGTSAILTFPTGAGKSTVSELKIAATLLSGKSVIYLVPTHALEDQIKNNLKQIFNDYEFDFNFEIDSEYTELNQTEPILVMTPERCLTLISVNEDWLSEVGLVIFDEFHLIHGKNISSDRRSVDAMFCLLLLFNTIPKSDYLLISAMVENGREIADWIAKVTGRDCISFDSSWKPTRQMLGCLVFQKSDIDDIDQKIATEKKLKKTKNPPTSLKKDLYIDPYSYYSLRNVWESKHDSDYYISHIFREKVLLSVSDRWQISPNRNVVAAQIAIHFARLGIKTLVFVDNPKNAISTANKISNELISNSESIELVRNSKKLLKSLEIELGDLKYSYVSKDGNVGLHHGKMLSLERIINELSFKQKQGISVIVATATLAQGINLPAEVVIIAGDDRYNEITGGRERIAPYELLNAAGRAGRAGMSSQGVVFLVPGQIVTIEDNIISDRWWKLKEDFSNSDQCLIISDPMEYFLDSIYDDTVPLTLTQKNIVYKFKHEITPESKIRDVFKNSFHAYKLAMENNSESFEHKVSALIQRRNNLEKSPAYPDWTNNISVKTGIDPSIINELGLSVDSYGIEKFSDMDVLEIINWFIDWLLQTEDRFLNIFNKDFIIHRFYKVLNLDKKSSNVSTVVSNGKKIKSLVRRYVKGKTYEKINKYIIGKEAQQLDYARDFILKLIPDISFAFGILSLTITEKIKNSEPDSEISSTIRLLASCIREGVDTTEKLYFKNDHKILSRVETHLRFKTFNS